MNMRSIMAGVQALPHILDAAPEMNLGNIFPDSYWRPSRPNKHTAKIKRKRRVRNKIARESRKKNRNS